MNLTHLRADLANARIALREAKDHYETTRAICELAVQTTGKNAEDRKRELTVALADDPRHTRALSRLRACETQLDRIQAEIDAAEDARREREWAIRERLANSLEHLHIARQEADDIDWHDLHFQTEQRRFNAIERDLRNPSAREQAQREMDELFK